MLVSFGSGEPYAILGPGPLAVPQLQCRDRHVGGVGGEAGQPQSVSVGDPSDNLHTSRMDYPVAPDQQLRDNP